MKNLGIIWLFILCATSSIAQEWNLEKDKEGVKVYTRKVAGWGIKQYKANVTIQTTLSQAQQTICAIKNRKKWLHNSIEVREVERPNNKEVAIYNKVDAPWPVADRDNIIWLERSI